MWSAVRCTTCNVDRRTITNSNLQTSLAQIHIYQSCHCIIIACDIIYWQIFSLFSLDVEWKWNRKREWAHLNRTPLTLVCNVFACLNTSFGDYCAVLWTTNTCVLLLLTTFATTVENMIITWKHFKNNSLCISSLSAAFYKFVRILVK